MQEWQEKNKAFPVFLKKNRCFFAEMTGILKADRDKMGTLSVQRRRERKKDSRRNAAGNERNPDRFGWKPSPMGMLFALAEMAEKVGTDFQQGNAEREKCEKHGFKGLASFPRRFAKKYISWIFGGALDACRLYGRYKLYFMDKKGTGFAGSLFKFV